MGREWEGGKDGDSYFSFTDTLYLSYPAVEQGPSPSPVHHCLVVMATAACFATREVSTTPTAICTSSGYHNIGHGQPVNAQAQ